MMALHTYSGIWFGGKVVPNLEATSDALGIHGARSVGTDAVTKASSALVPSRLHHYANASSLKRSDHLHGVNATL
ncbi:hypothetical protein PC128_g27614 [Phytophthora cactorum]|nr:hypothetical protein PC128_g27614 [Phytophthora cactorum]